MTRFWRGFPTERGSRPRWLYSVGRKDEARQILANLHSRTRDINSPLINLEMEEIIEKIQVDGVDSMFPLIHFLGERN